MPEDNYIAIFVAKVSRFILCEIFANFYMVIKFADMDSDLKFSALRQILPGDTCIGVHLAGIEMYPVIYFCKHLCCGKFCKPFCLRCLEVCVKYFDGLVRLC